MTKKDYQLISRVILGVKCAWSDVPYSYSILEDLVDNLSGEMKLDNSGFDSKKFQVDCGFSEE